VLLRGQCDGDDGCRGIGVFCIGFGRSSSTTHPLMVEAHSQRL
jgi:hypothetical protein